MSALRVLLIFEEIPEDTSIYLLCVEADDYAKLLKCHNKYINCDDDIDCDWLSAFLLEHKENKVLTRETPVVFKTTMMTDLTIILTGFTM